MQYSKADNVYCRLVAEDTNLRLADIHIRLDREGLEGLTEKEISVLLSERIGQSTEQVCNKIDDTVLPIHDKLDEISGKFDKLDEKLDDTVLPIHDKLDEIISKFDKLDEIALPIHDKLDSIDGKFEETHEKIDEAVSPVHEELIRFREKVSFWAKVIASGIWAVGASLIASLIFRACSG